MNNHQPQIISEPDYIKAKRRARRRLILFAIATGSVVLLAFCCVASIAAVWMLRRENGLSDRVLSLADGTSNSTSHDDVEFRVIFIGMAENQHKALCIIALKNKSAVRLVNFDDNKGFVENGAKVSLSDEFGNNYRVNWMTIHGFPLRPGQVGFHMILFEPPVDEAAKLRIVAPTGLTGKSRLNFVLPIQKTKKEIPDFSGESTVYYFDKDFPDFWEKGKEQFKGNMRSGPAHQNLPGFDPSF